MAQPCKPGKTSSLEIISQSVEHGRGGGTGTASTAIAVPKLKQVGLSRTKMRVEIAAKLYTFSERYVMTINDYY